MYLIFRILSTFSFTLLIMLLCLIGKTEDCIEGNCINGKGKKVWQNGRVYIGDFKNGLRDGIGMGEINGNKYEGEWCFEKNISSAVEGSDAVVVLTEWQEYSYIDWKEISTKMRKPSWVFDSRSIVSKEQVLKANLNLWKIGDIINQQLINLQNIIKSVISY